MTFFELGLPPSSFELILFWLIVAGLVTILLSDFTFLPLALIHDRLQKRYPESGDNPLVTVIVPAFNEERTIGNLIDTLLEQSYTNIEVFVVNDGSTDNTAQVVKEYRNANVQLIDLPRPNRGKHAALNAGIALANSEIVVFMDADGIVERDCVSRLMAAFRNPRVMAVSGNVKVANRVNLLTRLQALDYIRDINIPRRAFDLLDISIVIPGPLGAFRRAYINSIGSYDPDTVAEDFDTTVKAHKAKDGVMIGVRNVTDAVAYTEAPENLRDLVKQRLRWYGGMTQTVVKHSDRRFLSKSGTYSYVAVPYIFATLFVVPGLELFLSALSIALAIVTGFVWYVLALVVYSLMETLTSFLALNLDKEDLRLVVYSPLFVLGYRQLLDMIRLYAFYQTARGRLKWTRAERYGRVREEARTVSLQSKT